MQVYSYIVEDIVIEKRQNFINCFQCRDVTAKGDHPRTNICNIAIGLLRNQRNG